LLLKIFPTKPKANPNSSEILSYDFILCLVSKIIQNSRTFTSQVQLLWNQTNPPLLIKNFPKIPSVATPLLEECEDETHTPQMGTWESTGTPKTSEFDCKGQNTSPWGVFYIIGKLSKCRCQKWACISHLKICSISYGKKKDRESNCQFDSRPLKVGNWPDPDACRWSVTHRWKALNESYKFALDLTLIRGPSKEL
jgi:hypothetical protein